MQSRRGLPSVLPVFSSDGPRVAGGRHRLTHIGKVPDTVNIKFEITPADKPGQFQTYIEASTNTYREVLRRQSLLPREAAEKAARPARRLLVSGASPHVMLELSEAASVAGGAGSTQEGRGLRLRADCVAQ